MDAAGAVALPEKFALSEFRGMVVGPGVPLHLTGVLRPRDGAALATGVAGRLPGGGDPESRATSWSTRSATSRSSSSGAIPTPSPPSSMRVPTAGPAWPRGPGTSPPPRSVAATTPGVGTSTGRSKRWSTATTTPPPSPTTTSGWARSRLVVGAASCSSTWIRAARASSPSSVRYPSGWPSYRFEDLRFRSYRTILFDCNWKTAVDAFNEAYHPQGLHPQMLTWYDDTRFTYEQFGPAQPRTARRSFVRSCGPSPRLGLDPEDYDEVELLADRIDAVPWPLHP